MKHTQHLIGHCKNISSFIIGVFNFRNCNQQIATKCFGNKIYLKKYIPNNASCIQVLTRTIPVPTSTDWRIIQNPIIKNVNVSQKS